MRLVFAGTPEPAVPTLDALAASDHDVVAVVTRPDARSGRGHKLAASPVAARASELGIEVLRPNSVTDPDFVAQLRDLAPDCCPVVAFGALLTNDLLAIPRYGWVNLHFSLLPRWRGAAPVQHAILAGDAATGAMTFNIVRALDAGDVYDHITTPISSDDTTGDLLTRLAVDGAQLMMRTLDAIADGTATATPQVGNTTLAPKITTEDAHLDWSRTAVELDRIVRACHPAPGAWTTFGGQRIKILRGRVVEATGGAPGTVEVGRRHVRVACAQGAVELVTVQPHGRKPMGGPDWGRGLGEHVEVVLGT